MRKLLASTKHRYRFYSFRPLTGAEQSRLIAISAPMTPDTESGAVLSGRGGIRRITLDDGSRGVVKAYHRGGIPGRFIRSTHFRIRSCSRGRDELIFLEQVRALGVRAPEPMVCMETGGFFYRTWIVTRELLHTRPLTGVILENASAVQQVMDDLSRQLKVMINSGILHVDLHPGNVLVDDDGCCHVIDFDRARSGVAPERARRFYLRRWHQALEKHGLSPHPGQTAGMLVL